MQPNDTLTQLTLLARRIMRRFSLDSLLMFALALISEVPVLLIRVVVVAVISVIFNYANGHSSAGPHWLWVGVIPTLWSMFALITPISSGWWWKQRIGGRSPSGRERLAYQDSIELLQSHTHKQLPLPKRWFVLDTNLPDAAVSGAHRAHPPTSRATHRQAQKHSRKPRTHTHATRDPANGHRPADRIKSTEAEPEGTRQDATRPDHRPKPNGAMTAQVADRSEPVKATLRAAYGGS